MEDIESGSLNPFVAYTDVMINLTLIMLLLLMLVPFIELGGNADVRYKKYMLQLEQAVRKSIPQDSAPKLLGHRVRNDPLGTHRWLFTSGRKLLFVPGSEQLTPEGKKLIKVFAHVLETHKDKWRRIRIEGHVKRSQLGDVADWRLSTLRAISVAQTIAESSDIQFHQISVSGRGSQSPLRMRDTRNPLNDRVEIVVEFAYKDAQGNDLPR